MWLLRSGVSALLSILLVPLPAFAQDPLVRSSLEDVTVSLKEVPSDDCGGDARTEPVSGIVRGVAPSEHRIVIYSFDCEGVWWVQPSEAAPKTLISTSGEWEAYVHLGRRYAVLVVSPSFQPPTRLLAMPEVSREVVAIAMVRGTATKASPSSKAIVSVPAPAQLPADSKAQVVVMAAGRLTSGFDMGVNSSRGRTDWVTSDTGEMTMAYPAGQEWGAVFVTVGPPRDSGRSGQDFSGYRTLVVEMRGRRGDEVVELGLKDSADPDDGSESKVRVRLQTAWQPVEIPLTSFRTADLRRLYVVTEFVFTGPQPVTISARRISFGR